MKGIYSSFSVFSLLLWYLIISLTPYIVMLEHTSFPCLTAAEVVPTTKLHDSYKNGSVEQNQSSYRGDDILC